MQHQLIHSLMLREVYFSDDKELWFDICSRKMRFSMYEFVILTGLCCFGDESDYAEFCHSSSFCDKYFKDESKVSRRVIEKKFMSRCWENDNEDAVKFAKIYLIQCLLLSTHPETRVEMKLVHLIDCERFDEFPWGRYIFEKTVGALKHKLVGVSSEDYQNNGYFYRLSGFPYIIQIWFYECLVRVPDFLVKLTKSEVSPRMLRWKPNDVSDLKDVDYKLFKDSMMKVSMKNIEATEDEVSGLDFGGLGPQPDENELGFNDSVAAKNVIGEENVDGGGGVPIHNLVQSLCSKFFKDFKADIVRDLKAYVDSKFEVLKKDISSLEKRVDLIENLKFQTEDDEKTESDDDTIFVLKKKNDTKEHVEVTEFNKEADIQDDVQIEKNSRDGLADMSNEKVNFIFNTFINCCIHFDLNFPNTYEKEIDSITHEMINDQSEAVGDVNESTVAVVLEKVNDQTDVIGVENESTIDEALEKENVQTDSLGVVNESTVDVALEKVNVLEGDNASEKPLPATSSFLENLDGKYIDAAVTAAELQNLVDTASYVPKKVTKYQRKRKVNPSSVLKSPFKCFDTPEKIKNMGNVFRDHCPLTVENVGEKHNLDWEAEFYNWVEIDIVDLPTKNVKGKKKRKLVPTMSLGGECVSKKDFFYKLSESGCYLESDHIDILFGYLRKKCSILWNGYTVLGIAFDAFVQATYKSLLEGKEIGDWMLMERSKIILFWREWTLTTVASTSTIPYPLISTIVLL
ncbi:uncharacterized protein LOC126674720 [Mercurialis annua]|uniref:uncharacterized protein LOC126674720 n=1 Tax=Mercurialis annua TaxID=3986 RepID=UPI0024AD8BFB|nr:uncharacterized protein LOC126674720 [Mercurialis annua]